jgi:hypothetical protein
MAYCIFIKSLRILEEFRKNPCVKIPLKSPYANFQILGKFKNPIFLSKRISLQFRPSRPTGLSSLSAQLGLLVQLSLAAHPFPTSSRNQCHRRPGLTPSRLHHLGHHGCPSSQRQSSPSSFTPWPLLPPFKSCLNPP